MKLDKKDVMQIVTILVMIVMMTVMVRVIRKPLPPVKVDFPQDPNREIRVQLERKQMEKVLAELEEEG